MNCTRCDGNLNLTHTFKTPSGRTQRWECEDCYLVHTVASILINVDPKQGQGAYAQAQRLRAGKQIEWSNSTKS